jgi:hypothetical protein
MIKTVEYETPIRFFDPAGHRKDNTFISLDTLYNAWKDMLGCYMREYQVLSITKDGHMNGVWVEVKRTYIG